MPLKTTAGEATEMRDGERLKSLFPGSFFGSFPERPGSDVGSKMAACHVEKNLTALRRFPRVALNNIRDLPEAFITVSAMFKVVTVVYLLSDYQ